MFLKKSLLFTTALALLMFAGQASAQVSLTLGEGGSAGTVSGAGTEITVDVSQMGVDASVNAIQVVFDIDWLLIRPYSVVLLAFFLTVGNKGFPLSIPPGGTYRCPQVPVLPLPQLQM